MNIIKWILARLGIGKIKYKYYAPDYVENTRVQRQLLREWSGGLEFWSSTYSCWMSEGYDEFRILHYAEITEEQARAKFPKVFKE